MSSENNVSNLLKNTPPLTFEDLKDFKSKYERAFARLLLLKGLLVWKEPRIKGGSKPDFLVVNPKSSTRQPRLVEITQSNRKKALINKKKQITNMRKSGLPWMLLTRENLLKVAAANPVYRRGL